MKGNECKLGESSWEATAITQKMLTVCNQCCDRGCGEKQSNYRYIFSLDATDFAYELCIGCERKQG